MKEIRLSVTGKNRKLNLVALVDDSDFEWLNQWKWHATKPRSGRTFYVTRTLNPGTVKMHRLILGLTNPKIIADHRDGNGLNNQRENIRVASRSQNAGNKQVINKHGFKGVFKAGKKFGAGIMKNGVSVYLGCFETPVKAAEAYNTAALLFFGRFAKLNKTMTTEPI